MSSGIWSAASGAIGHLSSLDITANNLANASTAGFQGDRAVFHQVLAEKERAGAATEYRRYAVVSTRAPDTSVGAITSTGRALDAAIEGEGYFMVQTDQGVRYTRNGSFQVSDGKLVIPGGNPVLDAGRAPITVGEDQTDVRVGADGTVYAGADAIGQIALVTVERPEALEREGTMLFRAPDAAVQTTPTALVTESLEASNVSVVKSMTDIVTATRSFDAVQRAIETFSEIERKAAMGIMGSR